MSALDYRAELVRRGIAPAPPAHPKGKRSFDHDEARYYRGVIGMSWAALVARMGVSERNLKMACKGVPCPIDHRAARARKAMTELHQRPEFAAANAERARRTIGVLNKQRLADPEFQAKRLAGIAAWRAAGCPRKNSVAVPPWVPEKMAPVFRVIARLYGEEIAATHCRALKASTAPGAGVASLVPSRASSAAANARIDALEETVEALRGRPMRVFNLAHLTASETRLLLALVARDAGTLITRDALILSLHGDRPEADWPEPKTIEVHMHRLKAAVGPLGITIETVWGEGWTLDATSRRRALAGFQTKQAEAA